MRPLRVAFVISRLGIGGAEHQMLSLAAALDRRLFLPIIVCLKDPGPMASHLGGEVEIVSLGHMNGNNPLVVRSLVQVLRSRRVELVHCTNFNATLWGRAAARHVGIPAITAEHSTVRGSARERCVVHWANRFLDSTTYAVVACACAQIETLVSEGCEPSHIRVIHNGVDPDRFTGLEEEGLRVRRILGALDDEVQVTLVANLAPQKNQMLLVDAVSVLKNEGLALSVWIVGEGLSRASLEGAVSRYGLEDSIRLLGTRSDVPSLLAGSDIAVLTSNVEAFPMCLLEAMASGLPVVATAVGGVPEMVLPGVTGELTAPGDLNALTSALRSLVLDSKRRTDYGRAGRMRACERFTLTKMVGAYEALLLEAAGLGSELRTVGP